MYACTCRNCNIRFVWGLRCKSQLAMSLCEPCFAEIRAAWYKNDIDDRTNIFEFIDAYIVMREISNE
ncbi:MAG: hypothetical protein K0R18_420 [Bacillales bacterium]|nr:hypothetical protein [Bacillales bacterium]